MQALIIPYLTFNGHCREAMQFYQQCLGGKLYLQTIASMQRNKKMPDKIRNCILHSKLENGKLALMGSDIISEDTLVKGNSVSISLQSTDKTCIQKYFKNLSQGGRNIHPIKKTKWGTYFGSLTDKFDNRWLLTYKPKKINT